MLVLVVPQTYTSDLFVFNLRFLIIPAVIRIIFYLNWVFESLKKSNTFWLPNALVEIEAGHGTGCCMPCHLKKCLTIIHKCHYSDMSGRFTVHFKSFT